MDIVFQLLLFFVLTSAFLEPGLSLELPPSSREHERPETGMVIAVDEKGRVFINDAPVSTEMLEASLAALVRDDPNAAVILRGDKGVPYGGFFEVLDSVRSAGIKTISLAYENQEP
jgi:biopolymer transport protein ExbD